MLKKLFISLTIIATLQIRAIADEGMWLPMLIERLNYVDMQKEGLRLTAEEIYSINHSSLKDAIVSINGGKCSGFMLSDQGLLMTNHHCGLSFITDNSIKYNSDFVQNGFWAGDKKQELYNPNMSATFLVRIEDVTGLVLSKINDKMSIADKNTIISKTTSQIAKDAVNGTHYDAEVLPFFKGNEYYLFVYETFRDIRLVGAPPIAIGNFGADSDNWDWPRHSGDFALFRIYMGSDGKPAPYDKRRNVPYIPKKHIPISTKGVNEGDFVMSLGYPGITNRFTTSAGISMTSKDINPTYIKIREAKLNILQDFMEKDPTIMLTYRSKYNAYSNYWKYYKEQSNILDELKIYDKKISLENDFKKWVKANSTRKAKYSTVLDDIDKYYKDYSRYTKAIFYYHEAIFNGPELIYFTKNFDSLYFYLNDKTNPEELRMTKIADLSMKLKYQATNYFFNSYNINVDKTVFTKLLQIVFDELDSEFHPDVFSTIKNNYQSDISKYIDYLYENTIFCSKEKVYKFLRQPNFDTIYNDPAIIASESFYKKFAEIRQKQKAVRENLDEANRLFLSGLIEMSKGKTKFYPDGNATMRLTYGKVTKYINNVGKELPSSTTLDELILREDNSNSEFTVPIRLKALYNNKNFSTYTDKNGHIPVCFISSCDVTGGCSGAPTLNANGEMVGIVFDINREATASSLSYIDNKTKTISTDVRYILFIIDKYAEATNIMSELDIK